MKQTRQIAAPAHRPVERVEASPEQGLTAAQVAERVRAGAVNAAPPDLTGGVGRIIRKNVLTLFNLINLVLFTLNLIAGYYKDTLFILVAVSNTLLGIIQELRAARTLNRLSVLAETRVTVIRDGAAVTLPQHEVVLDDIMLLVTGNQITADGQIVDGAQLEVDESLLTGESDRIRKENGDGVLSGSFVTGGRAAVRVMAVGSDNYATAITAEAKGIKKNKSKLLHLLNMMIRILTVMIIPLGLILFFRSYNSGGDFSASVSEATVAMLGMIPEGLVLLTGITLTVGAMNLARKKALVQSLPSIETLARTDVLCLDKTGTITDGTMRVEGLELFGDTTEEAARRALSELMGILRDEGATAEAIRAAYGDGTMWRADVKMPFSSDRKWSGAAYPGRGSFVLGAPSFVLGAMDPKLAAHIEEQAAQGLRVLALAHSPQPLDGRTLPPGLRCAALVLLSDHIRPDAPATFRFFIQEGVALKVISGDHPTTVAAIAARAGLPGAEKAIDMSAEDARHIPIDNLAAEYTVFGRVSPQQKRDLVRALQRAGHTVCMTGDGVNDILAMRESDCSVAMVGGSDASRNACDFVLMSSSFSSLTEVLGEGRRVINNIERVASLYLVKTIYSLLLTLIYIGIPYTFPFSILQMTPVSLFTVGVPTFFLALQRNYAKPVGQFAQNVLLHSLPAALTIVFNTLIIQLAAVCFDLPLEQYSTMNVLLIGTVGFILLFRVNRPLKRYNLVMFSVLMALFLALFLVMGSFFELHGLLNRNAFFYLPLMYSSYGMLRGLSRLLRRMLTGLRTRRSAA